MIIPWTMSETQLKRVRAALSAGFTIVHIDAKLRMVYASRNTEWLLLGI